MRTAAAAAAAAAAATTWAWKVGVPSGSRSRAPALLGSAAWSTCTRAAAPSAVKGKQRQQRTWYSHEAKLATQPLSSARSPYEPESSKNAQMRAAEAAQLLEQVRAAHIDADAAITAYARLRRDPQGALHELSDVKLERLCEAIVAAHARIPAGMMVSDLKTDLSGPFRAAPGSWRRLKALQILLGRGFSADGRDHVLNKTNLSKALRLATADSETLGAMTNKHASAFDSGSSLPGAVVLRHLDPRLGWAFIRECCNNLDLPARDFLIAVLHHIRSSKSRDVSKQDRLSALEVARLSHHLYFRSSEGSGDPRACSDMIMMFGDASRTGEGQFGAYDLRVARKFASQWLESAGSTEEMASLSSFLELAALCVRAYVRVNWCTNALHVVKQLHRRLDECSATVESHSKFSGSLAAALPAELLREVLYTIAATSDPKLQSEAASRLIQAFQMFESTLLPYIHSSRILSLTGRIQSLAQVSNSLNGAKAGHISNGRVEVGQLLETALRSRQSAALPGSESQEALITAILKSPLFPILFIHLVRVRRGDLVGSLLELLQFVPPLPASCRGQGSLASLSHDTAVSWVGQTNAVISTDRPVIIQAAAQAKLRWHSAFLYHRWAEGQLTRDNAMSFERLGGLVGTSAPLLEGFLPRPGLAMATAQQVVQSGLSVKSNPVMDSATCTWNMVKLFATSDVAPQSASNLHLDPTRSTVTEAEFARLIFSTFRALNSGRVLKPEDTTTMVAAAFALNDTSTALHLLASKLQTGNAPDIVDIGVVLAGFANNNVEVAVSTFLNKLNNVESAGPKDATAQILERLEPAPELYSMLISKCVFRGRRDLVSQLLADADARGLMSTAILRSLDVILRQNIDLRPQQFLHLLEQLTYADDWTPDPRILAWFCRCAARGQSLKEAMERVEAHAAASGANARNLGEGEDTLSVKQLGSLPDLTAAVGILGLSAHKLGYVHGPTALLLAKLIPQAADENTPQQPLTSLLDRVAQMVFHAERIDAGAQQRTKEGTKWQDHKATWRARRTAQEVEIPQVQDRNSSVGGRTKDLTSGQLRNIPREFFDDLIRAYLTLYDFKGAAEVVLWMNRAGLGYPTLSSATRRLMSAPRRRDHKGMRQVQETLEGKGHVALGKVFWAPLKRGSALAAGSQAEDGIQMQT
ncbi:unnamed protein product [Tilletia laevis]|uniref:Uncharacterized protein n=2 Tax=Tilletia TaxID=13289 RepID=A0A9N8MC67_9BASI|nr:hypothetical protein CF336_g1201 [Tilletia laevis]KAE8264608.1 hypothetical protein A4X03_0g824 [Tilletia caries]CAD6891148.1 unnamed protein product [Tilletia caries]CAD6949773.1 unnamed protein product [Tilletia laevis]CAD6953717.1 unnamed protein product [Tilletia caries]